MIAQVVELAADLAEDAGADVEAALARFVDAGDRLDEQWAALWLSVAFLFARHNRP